MRRADVALVERKLFASRAKAQEAIAAGRVSADGRRIVKPSECIDPAANIEATPAYPWISRGGIKLAVALDALGFDPSGLHCLDIGASTGGFTHVLLTRGAARVFCVDVGHGQLHPDIAKDPRVEVYEGMDARAIPEALWEPPPSFISCDVSFISLDLVLPAILPRAAKKARLIALIKPQFEAGPGATRKGVVKSDAIKEQACEKIKTLIQNLGWELVGLMSSPIIGSDGNQEFLLGAMKA
ncbi:MAG: TlyA family RNA methyltransferase [Alphaproteobacteria bacterium]|nr:TlyA family RNA methyltransferase [Alphaproteobacteria bacterium]